MSASKRRNTTYVVEQILKDFLRYLQGVRERFKTDDDGTDWDSPIVLVNCTGRAATKISSSVPPMMAWTNQEADKHKEKLRFFGRALGEQMRRLPRENLIVKGILENMKSAIREGMRGDGPYVSRHIVTLIENTSKLLHIVQPLDLEKLIALMKNNRRAGDCMEGKDVVLLLGSVGSGKTTTLHFLAGASFAEVEVDGFFHLKPTEFVDPSVTGYKTSCGREAITKGIQTAEVTVDGVDVVLCDTPGFGENEEVEEDIANGLGIVRALHRANTVRPVLVLSREGMGDRFNAFSETLSSVTRLLGNADSVDLKPFNYVFTKYEKRHRTCMCRQFILIRKRPRAEEEGKILFRSFVDDVIQKTTPDARISLPMEGGPHHLLRDILQDQHIVPDPKAYFVPYVSGAALRRLKLQLQITLRDVMTALAEEDYGLAVYRVKQLSNLALVLPEAGECAQLGLEASLRHIGIGRERVVQIIEHAQEVKIHKQYTQLLEVLKQEISNVLASEHLRKVCAHFEKESNTKKRRAPDGNESFCSDQVHRLVEFVCQDVPQFDPQYLNTEALMKRRGSFLTAVVRLKEMSEILCSIPGDNYVASMYKIAFLQFHTFVDCVLSEAEHSFHNSSKDVQNFERQAWFLAVLIQGFLNKPNSGTGEHEKMEELENRRLTLMLRLEIKISDTMELVDNTRFPDGNEEDSNPDSLPLVKLGGLRGPRQLLLSISQLPRLCKFLPSKIDISEVETSVTVLDKKIVTFLEGTAMKAESVFNRLETKNTREGDATAMEGAVSMRHDLKMVIEEFTGVRRWSTEIEIKTKKNWDRLLIVQDAVDSSIGTMEENMGNHNGLGFTCGVLSSSILPKCAR